MKWNGFRIPRRKIKTTIKKKKERESCCEFDLAVSRLQGHWVKTKTKTKNNNNNKKNKNKKIKKPKKTSIS